MGQAVADVAHAAQNDVDADEAAERADDHRRDETVTKKLVLKRNEERHYISGKFQSFQKFQSSGSISTWND
jgi:hypothetical protein